MDGDEELIREIIKMFLETISDYTRDIRTALDAKDPEKLKYFAHRFKGSALNASALTAAGLLLKLETLGARGSLDGSEEIFSGICSELEKYKIETAALNLRTVNEEHE